MLRFGTLRYFPADKRLVDADDTEIHLRSQSAEVLAVLSESPNRLVPRDELIARVWGDIATTDDSLIQCVADIRRVLGKEAVRTFPKKGYMLSPDDGAPESRRSRLVVGTALAAAVAVAFLWRAADTGLPEAQDRVAIPPIRKELTLAVLPFANLGEDPDLRYFSDGLSEDLVTDLSRVGGLTVISAWSSFDYRNVDQGFRSIAEELDVRYLVRGTVRHSGERVRINVSLVDPIGGSNLWSERYDRNRGDPFDVQSDVAREIMTALSLELGADPPSPSDTEPEAYYALLKGLEPLRRRTVEGAREARDRFREAIGIAPDYARAHAFLAVSYGREIDLSDPTDLDSGLVENGVEAAIRAIQLDPRTAEAYIALATLNLATDQYETALSAARHALTIDPNSAEAYALLAEISVRGGRLEEGLDAIRRAKRLHPHHPADYDVIEGHLLFHLSRYDEAEDRLRSAVARSPHSVVGLSLLAATLGHQARTESVGDILAELRRLSDRAVAEPVKTRYLDDARSARLTEGLRKAGAL